MSDGAAHIVVSGLVQGVGFRFFVTRKAEGLGLTGFVRNLPDGNVEVLVRGSRSIIGELVAALKIGPSTSRVKAVSLEWLNSTEDFDSFEIR